MADYKNLAQWTLIFIMVSILAGAGVILLDSFSDASRNDTPVTSENVTISNVTGTVTNTFIRSIENCRAHSAGNTTFWTLTTGSETSGAECTFNDFGAVRVNDSSYTSVTLNYTAGLASNPSQRVDDARSALGEVSEDWLSLIVTVSILAIILGLVLFNFAPRRR